MGSDFKRHGLESASEFLLAEKDIDQGQYGECDEEWSIVKLFHSKVTNHGELVQYKSSYNSNMYMGPHSPIALIGWNTNFECLPNKNFSMVSKIVGFG